MEDEFKNLQKLIAILALIIGVPVGVSQFLYSAIGGYITLLFSFCAVFLFNYLALIEFRFLAHEKRFRILEKKI